jgi:hypothetical protein
MSNTKKILSIVLAVVMAFSVFSICAFADTDTATWTLEVTDTSGNPLPGTISTGDQVLVTVKLQTNFYVGTVGLPVVFSDAFEYVDASVNQVDIYGAGATRKAFNDDFDAGISGTNAVYAVYVPNSGASGVGSPMYSSATTILSFVLEAVNEATADISIPASMQKTAGNPGGKFYCGSRASSDVTTDENMVGQTFNVSSPVSVIISDVVATPELQGINTGVVDNDNGYVYGVPASTSVSDFANYFTVTNGGSFTISGNGTGATLTVKDAGGTDITTYTLIIFGDVNGDGIIAASDVNVILLSFLETPLSGYQAVAADVNGDGGTAATPSVTASDVNVLQLGFLEVPYSDVNPYA